MAFQNVLLDQIERESLEGFERYVEEVKQSRYGHVFLYALGISNEMGNRSPFKEDYFFLGGFAVLGHMIDVKGPNIINQWRGSHDIDIACKNREALERILADYGSQEAQSLSLPDKMKATLNDPQIGAVCQADLYYPSRASDTIRIASQTITSVDFKNAVVIDIFGIPFRVYDRHQLLSTKLNIVTGDNLPRDKDMVDIYNLLGVCERKGETGREIYQRLGSSEGTMLVDVLKYTQQKWDNNLPASYITTPTRKLIGDINKAHRAKHQR